MEAAVAYRWGVLNEHQYLVAVGDSVDDRAKLEVAERGGKYGVAVYEIGRDGEPSDYPKSYYPSMRGERGLRYSFRKLALTKIACYSINESLKLNGDMPEYFRKRVQSELSEAEKADRSQETNREENEKRENYSRSGEADSRR